MKAERFTLSSCLRISKLLSLALLTLLSIPFATSFASPLSGGAFVAQPAPLATVIEVNTTGDGDNLNPNAGCDTDAAAPGEQCSLRAAIQRANALAGDEDIKFNIPATQPDCDSATGKCTINLTQALPEVSDSLRIEGPGAAKLTVRRNTGGNYRIFTLGRVGGSTITVTLSGLTISNGLSSENGGGIRFYGKTLNVLGCAFSENAAELFGGGIHAQGALNVADSVFRANQAKDQSGGGINAQDALTVTGSTFTDNKAPFFGGGIFANHSTAVEVRITDSTFERNSAQNGGALAMSASNMQVTNCIIRNNTPTAGYGGIYQTAGTLTVTGCTISDNKGFGLVALRGIIGGAPATTNINNSTISGNTGGGITTGISPNADSKLSVTGSTISSNKEGPGITIANRGTVNVFNSTISFNEEGGIKRIEPATAPGTWTVKSSIIAMNKLDDVKGDFTSGGFNLIGKTDNSTGFTQPTDLTGTAASPLDPRLDPAGPKNNGGPTQTIALHPGSPALDRGTANSLNGALTTDQRGAGFARIFDNPVITNAAGGDGTDIGAFERNAADPIPPTVLQLSAVTYSINENGGAAIVTVTRTGDNASAVSVKYSTSAGTATPGTVDYTEVSGTLNWAAGDFSAKTFSVPITNDPSDEENETIKLKLSDPQGGAQLGGQSESVLTIVDDDAVPLVNIEFSSVNEGNSGVTTMAINANLSVASGKVVTVRVGTVAGGTATPGTDYTPIDNVLLTFNPGQTKAGTTLQVFGDTDVEPDETIVVKISNATNGQVAGFQTSCRIRNDDVDQPTSELKFSAANYSVNEGAGTATIEVTRTGSTSGTATVRYTMASGTATINSDYTNTFGELTFENGQATRSFTIPIINDSSREPDEVATVTLSSPTGGASLGTPSMAVLTIVDNDPQPTISINDVTVAEGNSGTTDAGFTVKLSAPTFETVTVNYATVDDTAAGNDYQTASAALTFNPGETTKTINVVVNGDQGDEQDETFFFNLSNAQNATIGDAQGLGKILNDDRPLVQFSSPSYQIKEDAGNTPLQFASVSVEVTRTGDASGPATVRFSTSDASGGNECDKVTGQASQRCDYMLAAGTLRFAAGENSKTINIPIINDGYVEGNESFTIELQNPDGAALGMTTQAAVTIEDNDNTPTDGANNPYLNNQFFVRMSYLDYLGRDADQQGFADWTTVLNNCGPEKGFLGAPKSCDRAHVTHGFFASPEFTDTGFLIYRLYEVGMGRLPLYNEFIPGMATLSGHNLSPSVQQQNMVDYLREFTSKQEFINRFQDVSQPAQAALLVGRLEQAAGLTLPATATTLPGQPAQYGRQELIQKRQSGQFTLAETLKAFVEQQPVYDRYFPRGQVTMLYFSHLRRDPSLNDPNLIGWTDWVDVFTNGKPSAGIAPRDIHHLIFGFIYSEEYRKRFGQP